MNGPKSAAVPRFRASVAGTVPPTVSPVPHEHVVDMVVTDLAVFTIDKHGDGGMALIELADGVTLDEVKAKTEAEFRVALKNT